MALVLSTLIIFGYSWWMGKHVLPPAKPPATSEKTAAPAAAPRQAPETAASRLAQKVEAPPEKAQASSPARAIPRGRPVFLETSSVLARFSTTGGRLVSWQLKGFRATGTTIFEEMVPLRAAASPVGPLSVRLSDSEESAWAQVAASGPPARDGEKTLVFTANLRGGRTLVKKFTIPDKGHMAVMELELTGPLPASLDVVWKPGTGLSPAEEEVLGRPGTYQNIGTADLLTARDKFREKAGKKPVMKEGEAPFWASVRNKYFLSALIPAPVAGCVGVESIGGFAATEGVPDILEAGLRYRLKPGVSRVRIPLRVYIGPQDYGVLKKAGARLDVAIDFGMFGIFAVWLLYTLKFLASFTFNYGVAIILLTIIVRGILWWPSQSSLKQMQKMKEVQPQINFINEKFKDDAKRKQEEMMRLFKEKKINPLGGCLPFALQLPVFFALFAVLGNAVELRGAPFMLWITDLSAKDPIYVLPGLVGVTMWFQQAMTPTTGDPKQAKMMRWMSLVFVFMFANAPSGLNLYWLVQNLIQMGQQFYTTKLMVPAGSRRTSNDGQPRV